MAAATAGGKRARHVYRVRCSGWPQHRQWVFDSLLPLWAYDAVRHTATLGWKRAVNWRYTAPRWLLQHQLYQPFFASSTPTSCWPPFWTPQSSTLWHLSMAWHFKPRPVKILNINHFNLNICLTLARKISSRFLNKKRGFVIFKTRIFIQRQIHILNNLIVIK